MATNFEKAESHVAQSLKEHPDSTRAFSNELRDMQRCETPTAFKQDMARLNDDLHKQGLLPGLQIVENEKTHNFELKQTDDAKAQSAPDNAAPARGAEHEQHHGRHRGRHHRHHGHGKHHEHDDEANDADSKDKGDSQEGKGDRDNPRRDKTENGPFDGSKIANDGSNMSRDDKEKYIVGELTKDTKEGGLGLTAKQAAGVIGSLEGESPDLYSGRVDHKHEHDLGFVNWIGGRKKALESFAKEQGKDPTDFKTQVSFMESELKGSEHRALDKLTNTTTVSEAAQAFTRYYERPGIPHMQARLQNAQLAFSRMGDWGNHNNQFNDGLGPSEVNA